MNSLMWGLYVFEESDGVCNPFQKFVDPPLLQSMKAAMTGCRGTQRIVSLNYLFGRPLIPYDFLKRIVTSKFRNMRNLMSVFFFRLLKMLFWLPKKRSPRIFRKAIRPNVFGKWTKEP